MTKRATNCDLQNSVIKLLLAVRNKRFYCTVSDLGLLPSLSCSLDLKGDSLQKTELLHFYYFPMLFHPKYTHNICFKTFIRRKISNTVICICCFCLYFVGAASTVNFTGALQTEHVRSPPFKHLELHSPTRSVYLEAPQNIDINTKGGDIFVKSKFSASFTSDEVQYVEQNY